MEVVDHILDIVLEGSHFVLDQLRDLLLLVLRHCGNATILSGLVRSLSSLTARLAIVLVSVELFNARSQVSMRAADRIRLFRLLCSVGLFLAVLKFFQIFLLFLLSEDSCLCFDLIH